MRVHALLITLLLLSSCTKNRQIISDDSLIPQNNPIIEEQSSKPRGGAKPQDTIAPNYILPNIYQVRVNGTPTGTAFPVPTKHKRLAGYNVFITAAHTLATVAYGASSTITITNASGKSTQVIRHATSKNFDAAVLVTKPDHPPLQISDTPLNDMPCDSYHYSYFDQIPDKTLIHSKGSIVYTDKNGIWAFLMPFAKGGSGAPLLVNGQVVGMINSRVLDENNNPTGIVHAIQIQAILDFVDNIQ